MSNFNELLAEASEVASETLLEDSQSLLDSSVNVLEGLEEALFESQDPTADFPATFDDNIDSLQFFNQSYTGIPQDDLERMYDPSVSADLINAGGQDFTNTTDLDEDAFDFGFGGTVTNFPIDFITADEQLTEDDEEALASDDEDNAITEDDGEDEFGSLDVSDYSEDEDDEDDLEDDSDENF